MKTSNDLIGRGLEAPPPNEVPWRGVDRNDQTRVCRVMARTWFAARQEVMEQLGTENVLVTMEPN
jgi:hypothetical protein